MGLDTRTVSATPLVVVAAVVVVDDDDLFARNTDIKTCTS